MPIVIGDPEIEVRLEFADAAVDLLSERHAIELVEQRFVEPLADPVRLWPFGPRSRMVHILDRQIELIFVPFGIAAILGAAVGQHPTEPDVVVVVDWATAVVQTEERSAVLRGT